MILTVTHDQGLDLARWEMALNLLTVLALDTRCFNCHRGRQIRYHDGPDDFFTRDLKWNPQTQTRELQPFWNFTLRFNISGSISGWIDVSNDQDLTIVKEAIQHALKTPYTRANRQLWEIDDLRRRAADRGDEERAEQYLEEIRHLSRISLTYYHLYDKERVQERQALYQKERPILGSDREWQTIYDKLTAAGAAIRAGNQAALVVAEPAPSITREAGTAP